MAHKTLVNGTSYDVSGGKTLVSGTSYSVQGGKVLVNGTVYDISFAPPECALFNGGEEADYDNFKSAVYRWVNYQGSYSSQWMTNSSLCYIKDGLMTLRCVMSGSALAVQVDCPYAWLGPFDFTQYTTLHFLAHGPNSASNNGNYRFGYSGDSSSTTGFGGVSSIDEIDMTTYDSEITIDISNVTGQMYVKVSNYNCYNLTLYITKIWLT